MTTISTESYLAQLGISMSVARDFVMSNVAQPRIVYDICKSFSVNNDMIAEVLQSEFPGLTGQGVADFFTANGFDGASLGFNSTQEGTFNSTGTLNIAEVATYEEATLYENISESYAQQIINNNSAFYDVYLLTETENIGSPADYGYTNDDGSFGGVHTYSADNGNELVVLNGTSSGNSGNYDLITADLIA